MFESFTDFARQTVVGAMQEADVLGHPAIGTEHLLLSLAKLPGLASIVLTRHEITPAVIAAEVAERTHQLPEHEALAAIGIDLNELVRKAEEVFGPDAIGKQPRVTELLRAVFDRAVDEATELGSTYEGRVFVGTEHLLLGLLRLGEGVGCDILFAHGVDLEEARTELTALFPAVGAVRASVDKQPAEQTARKLLQSFHSLSESDKNVVTPVLRELVQAQRAAWARVLEEIGRGSPDALVADYLSAVEPAVQRAEDALAAG
jgi:ATP-dependent Clp protease ATP-binding subunit ClpA